MAGFAGRSCVVLAVSCLPVSLFRPRGLPVSLFVGWGSRLGLVRGVGPSEHNASPPQPRRARNLLSLSARNLWLVTCCLPRAPPRTPPQPPDNPAATRAPTPEPARGSTPGTAPAPPGGGRPPRGLPVSLFPAPPGGGRALFPPAPGGATRPSPPTPPPPGPPRDPGGATPTSPKPEHPSPKPRLMPTALGRHCFLSRQRLGRRLERRSWGMLLDAPRCLPPPHGVRRRPDAMDAPPPRFRAKREQRCVRPRPRPRGLPVSLFRPRGLMPRLGGAPWRALVDHQTRRSRHRLVQKC